MIKWNKRWVVFGYNENTKSFYYVVKINNEDAESCQWYGSCVFNVSFEQSSF